MTRFHPRPALARLCDVLLAISLFGSAVSTAEAQFIGQSGLDLVCPLVEYERRQTLEDSRFELNLVKNEHRARERVFVMIEKLWGARAIEQEVYLDYRRLRDRSEARIGRLTTQIEQEEITLKQYALVCAQVQGESIENLQMRLDALQADFRRLDCALLEQDSEIAAIDHVFDTAMLEATRALAAGNIKSKYELVIDEYDLSQSRARVDSFRARTKNCKERLQDRQPG